LPRELINAKEAMEEIPDWENSISVIGDEGIDEKLIRED